MSETSSPSASFNENYRTLKDTADWLTNQESPDIDALVPKVEEAMRAYNACKERLRSVEQTLSKYFGNEEGEAEQPPPPDGNVEVPF